MPPRSGPACGPVPGGPLFDRMSRKRSNSIAEPKRNIRRCTGSYDLEDQHLTTDECSNSGLDQIESHENSETRCTRRPKKLADHDSSRPNNKDVAPIKEVRREQYQLENYRIYWFTSTTKEKLFVRFERPGSDENCPLTLLPMCTDSLSIMPDRTFFPDAPDLRKLILPCGHAFGALNLVYHFCNSKMQCPLCRSGLKSPMDPRRLPEHLIDPLLDAVLRMDDDEIYETEFDAFAWIVRLLWHSRMNPVFRGCILAMIASAALTIIAALLFSALLLDLSAFVSTQILLPFFLFRGLSVH